MPPSDLKRFVPVCALFVTAFVYSGAALTHAQEAPVTIQFEIAKRAANPGAVSTGGAGDASNVVVWLTPLDHPSDSAAHAAAGHTPQLVQRNKAFEPHVLVVQAGTLVEFPNKDPFFHNVFSLFNGKRFDLGLYEAGSSRTVRFERTGVSFLFCNIHEEMSAVIVAVDTPYFGLSDRSGHAAMGGVPDGRYQMHVWYERSLPADLQGLERSVVISGSTRAIEAIRVPENPQFTLAHKNKYGQDYVPPASGGYSN
jgi:plastocyanin